MSSYSHESVIIMVDFVTQVLSFFAITISVIGMVALRMSNAIPDELFKMWFVGNLIVAGVGMDYLLGWDLTLFGIKFSLFSIGIILAIVIYLPLILQFLVYKQTRKMNRVLMNGR